MIALLLVSALPGLALAVLTWLASLPLRDASIADRVWPLLVGLPAATAAFLLPAVSQRGAVMLALLAAWALRLGIFISWRNWGHGEDRRYAAMRAEHGRGFALRSLATVFLLQGAIAWIVAWPVIAGSAAGAAWNALDTLGAMLTLFGIGFEALADAQLARFRQQPAQRGQVLQQGLWRWSRHPNYFGECCIWWGLALMALAGGGLQAAWTLASPVLMTVLLLRVSGVALLERDIGERRPGYADYMRRTSAFFPRPPRRQP